MSHCLPHFLVPRFVAQVRAGIFGVTKHLANLTEGQDLIVFDGECVLCSRFFRFMVARDKARRFKFATAQSPLGQRLYSDLGLPTQDFETNLVVTDGVIHQHLDAFAAAMRCLPGFWPVLSVCRWLPRFIKDPLYHAIARNRYAIFGRSATCMVPDADLRSRFLPEGF
ncbi:thiol-disulfide oxidoreductase DCC family protein [Ruegeria arenilitoris]|uniref:thiol-disulfide oxidoreductase DCC family protein n=1 Tax=Ruegeria arenilitoris TaxID=1173585 RepID=UPI003463CF4F